MISASFNLAGDKGNSVISSLERSLVLNRPELQWVNGIKNSVKWREASTKFLILKEMLIWPVIQVG